LDTGFVSVAASVEIGRQICAHCIPELFWDLQAVWEPFGSAFVDAWGARFRSLSHGERGI
jgi:hypothetical protein